MDRKHRLAGLAAAGLLLAGCATPDAPPTEPAAEPDRIPTTDLGPLPEVEPGALRLPQQAGGAPVVDPGWDLTPQARDGLALGAAEQDGVLTFTAVGADGDALWSAQRPVSCTGFAVSTTSDGRAIAVLTDTATTDDAMAATTATAYDLRTGAEVWGPVDVPGPHQGPGLVFAPAASDGMGETQPRVALDPDTGQVAAHGDDGPAVVGEYDGTVLAREDGELVAHRAHDGRERWRLEIVDHEWDEEAVTAAPEALPAGEMARLSVGDTDALVDLTDGEVLADGFTDVGIDPATRTVVSVDGTALRGTGPDGTELWSASAGAEVTIEAVSGALVYLRDGTSLRAHNVLTGNVAEAYAPQDEGDLVVPTPVPEAASLVLFDYSRYYLATSETVEPSAS